jgi:hypothetical protein
VRTARAVSITGPAGCRRIAAAVRPRPIILQMP